MMKFLTGFIAILICSITWAADPAIYAHKRSGAIKGADPVAFFSLSPGDKPVYGVDEYSYDWNGATWKFSSAENRDKFIADPEKYAPQYGGYCAFAVSHNFTKSVNPKYWHVVDDKLYLNFNRTANRKWLKDQQPAIARADENWPTVLSECEAHDNCG